MDDGVSTVGKIVEIKMEKFNIHTLVFCLLTIILAAGSGCERHYTAAKLTVSEVFPDPAVRKLANAAANGDVKKIDQLIDQGTDVNAQGKYGITPLWWAFMASNYDDFVHLLKRGANPNIQIKGGYENVMYASAMVNDSRFLEAAIKAGGNVNLVSEPDKTLSFNTISEGQTPLFGALYSEGMSNVDLLLANGANINFQNPDGHTILWQAHNYATIYYLLTKGADPTLKDKSGNTFAWVIKHKRIAPQFYPERQKVIDLLKARGMEGSVLEK